MAALFHYSMSASQHLRYLPRNVLKLVFAYMFSIRTTNKKTLSDVLLTVQVSKLPFTFMSRMTVEYLILI